MLSKIEGMIINSPETRKISSQNSFTRTSQQEHNSQLFMLLMQFKEALEKIPQQVWKSVEEMNDNLSGMSNTSTPSTVLANMGQQSESVVGEVKKSVQTAVEIIDDLAERQITDAIVALLAGYIQSIILGLHKEGVSNYSSKGSTAAGDIAVDCSMAVQTLSKQVPVMLKSHLISSLPKSKIVDTAVEEVCLRMMHSYVTVASLCRPMSEALRLRTAKDMSSLEMLISGLISMPNTHLCPVSQEFKSYRRLLFIESEQKNSLQFSASVPPSKTQLLQLPYLSQLRPSVLLGYLVSCAPSQLPSPYDVENRTLASYVQDLTEVNTTMIQKDSDDRNGSSNRIFYSVRSLYFHSSSSYGNNNMSISSSWSKIDGESKCWSAIQQCEDIFFQRIAVAEGAQKQHMREWYEAILEIGSHFFGEM